MDPTGPSLEPSTVLRSGQEVLPARWLVAGVLWLSLLPFLASSALQEPWAVPPTFIPVTQLLSDLGVVGATHHANLYPASQLLEEGSHLGVDLLQIGGGRDRGFQLTSAQPSLRTCTFSHFLLGSEANTRFLVPFHPNQWFTWATTETSAKVK